MKTKNPLYLLLSLTLCLLFTACHGSSDNKFGPQLYNPNGNMVLGNPDGDVTLVEFFDYNCGYCKKVAPELIKLATKDQNLRVIYKEYPILGPSSQLAARAALAAGMQSKYIEMHDALLAHHGHIDFPFIRSTAVKLGINANQLTQDMNRPEIAKELEQNLVLGHELGLRGTPAFFIGDSRLAQAGSHGLKQMVVMGAATLASFQKDIAKVRHHHG